jgi:glycosyltransferase involved in cell wall biosynthesis
VKRLQIDEHSIWAEMHVKVSVLLTTYNHEKFIAQAVDSVLMQVTDFDFEIVIM